MVFILFILTLLLTCLTYNQSKLKLLSPTFWAAAMFTFYSFVYCVTISSMKADLSISTVAVILSFLMFTYAGEFIGTNIRIAHNGHKKQYSSVTVIPMERTHGQIEMPIWKILVLTGVYMYVALKRYMNLAKIVNASGEGLLGAFDMISLARTAFVKSNGRLVLGNVVENQIVYFCEITSYIIIFIFVYNYLIAGKKKLYLLLPLIPDMIIRFVSTSRTTFIMLIFSVLICIIVSQYKQRGFKRVKIPKSFIAIAIMFTIAFFIYGRYRNNAYSFPLITYMQAYTSAALYGLDYRLINSWKKPSYFGMNTMQNIYDMIGSKNSEILMGSGMIQFTRTGFRSNLTTSLLAPIMDYTVVGMLVLRFSAAVISSMLIRKFLALVETNEYGAYFYLYFVLVVIYSYLFSPIGDSFKDYFLNPDLMFRYLVYGFVLVKCFLRPRFVVDRYTVSFAME